jgi:uncharacterized protein (DUF736 family)
MPVIGTFQPVKDGYAGSIRTLTLNGRVRILANDRKTGDGAPDFRISLGTTEIGTAWRRTKQGTDRPGYPLELPLIVLADAIEGRSKLEILRA